MYFEQMLFLIPQTQDSAGRGVPTQCVSSGREVRRPIAGRLRCKSMSGTCGAKGRGFLDNLRPDHATDAPSNYHLFPGLKKQLKGRLFSSDAEVIPAAETWLDGQLSEFF